MLSLSQICLLPMAPPEFLRLAAEVGFDAAGLRVEPAQEQEARFPLASGSPMLREVRRILADTGLGVLDAEVFRLLPGRSFGRYRGSLEICAELGIRNLLTVCNVEALDVAADRLAEACAVAGEYGLTVSLEFMPWLSLRNLEIATGLVREVGCANAGVVIDTLHVHRSGMTADALDSIDPGLVRYLQLCDATEPPADFESMLHQARYDRRMPGDGVIPLTAYLHRIPAGLPISVEIPMRDRLTRIGPVAFAREAHDRTRAALALAGR